MAVARITSGLAAHPPPVPDGAAKVRVFDDAIRGLVMEHRASGGVTFWFRYSDTRRRQREHPIGRLGDVTVSQARRRASELRAEVSLGGDPARDRDRRRAVPTYGEFIEGRFLPHVESTTRSHSTYESLCRLRLVPALGRLALDEIDASSVQSLRRGLIGEGLSAASVNRHLVVLRRSLNLAIRWGLLEGRNPAQFPDLLREQPRERYLTKAEMRAMAAAIAAEPDRVAAAAVLLLALTGARRNEVLRAQWSDVDLERRQLAVPISKSGRRRLIPLSDAALRVLASLPRPEGNTYVLPSPRLPGRPIEGAKRAWARIKAAAGLPADLRLHDLRHNLASLLINTGWSLYEVGQILGHSQLSTTQRYAHLRQDRLLEAVNSAGAIAAPLPAQACLGEPQHVTIGE
jgi:integrase